MTMRATAPAPEPGAIVTWASAPDRGTAPARTTSNSQFRRADMVHRLHERDGPGAKDIGPGKRRRLTDRESASRLTRIPAEQGIYRRGRTFSLKNQPRASRDPNSS